VREKAETMTKKDEGKAKMRRSVARLLYGRGLRRVRVAGRPRDGNRNSEE